MTTESKRERMKTLLGNDADATDTVCDEYLAIASDLIMDKRYPFGIPNDASLPTQYEPLQCELGAWLFARRGALGEIVHNENGINRTYASADSCELLSRVTPFAKVV